jgi:hypothetical protein
MLSKKRLIQDQDRVIAEKLKVIGALKRHPDRPQAARTIAVCRRIISECERSKAIILSA